MVFLSLWVRVRGCFAIFIFWGRMMCMTRFTRNWQSSRFRNWWEFDDTVCRIHRRYELRTYSPCRPSYHVLVPNRYCIRDLFSYAVAYTLLSPAAEEQNARIDSLIVRAIHVAGPQHKSFAHDNQPRHQSVAHSITNIICHPFAIIFPMMFCRRLPNRSFVSLLWSEKYVFFGAPPHDEGVFENIVFLTPEKRYKAPIWHTSTKHHRKDGGKRITNNIYYRRRYLHFTFGLLSCLMTPHSSIEADPMTIHTFCTWPVFVPGTYLTYVPSVQAEGVLRRAIVPNYYVREHVRTYVRERLLSFFCLMSVPRIHRADCRSARVRGMKVALLPINNNFLIYN